VNASFWCSYTQKREAVPTSGTFELTHNKMQSMHLAKIYFDNIIIAHYFEKSFKMYAFTTHFSSSFFPFKI